jgi:hypothetical protein
VKAIEVSILWRTEGKGDTDMAVHYFQRITPAAGQSWDPRLPSRFEARLPNSPQSYDGFLIKIRWFVRVRVFPASGKQFIAERSFRMCSGPPSAPFAHRGE